MSMKLVYASSASHDRLRDEIFLRTLLEPWERLELRFDHSKTGNYRTTEWMEVVIGRFARYAEVVRQNLGEIVVFSDTDIQWIKPVQLLIKTALKDVDIAFQSEWFGGTKVNCGFIVARCTENVAVLFEKIVSAAGGKMCDQDVMNKLISRHKMPCSFGLLPEIFASDHLLPHISVQDAVIYHSINGRPLYSGEPAVEGKLRQHWQFQTRLQSSGLNKVAHRDVVFGRLYLGSNINLETLAKFSLAPDGRIIGGQHRNETSWRMKDGVLSFFHRNGSITTTFNQAIEIGGIPVATGPYLQGKYTHFLYPYQPMKNSAQILYLISSHIKYSKALGTLLPQLSVAGIRPEDLWITVAGSTANTIRKIGGITYSFVTENAYEYTALLDIVRREIQYDYVFLLHDTCHVGPKFKELVEVQPPHFSYRIYVRPQRQQFQYWVV